MAIYAFSVTSAIINLFQVRPRAMAVELESMSTIWAHSAVNIVRRERFPLPPRRRRGLSARNVRWGHTACTTRRRAPLAGREHMQTRKAPLSLARTAPREPIRKRRGRSQMQIARRVSLDIGRFQRPRRALHAPRALPVATAITRPVRSASQGPTVGKDLATVGAARGVPTPPGDAPKIHVHCAPWARINHVKVKSSV